MRYYTMTKLILDYPQYNEIVEKLALIIHQNYKPTILIGIMRGAGPIVDILSRLLKIPVAYVLIQSYGGESIEDIQGSLKFAEHITSIASKNDFKNILLVDDLSDTGNTFKKTIDWLENNDMIKQYIHEIKTACLWKKKSSSFTPDFCPVHLSSDPWIVQPNEKYEETTIHDIIKKHTNITNNKHLECININYII